MNTTDTMEERFDKHFSNRPIREVIRVLDMADRMGFKFDYSEFKDFIKSEQSKLIEDILAKKKWQYPDDELDMRRVVSVEDILEVASQHGIISNDKKEL